MKRNFSTEILGFDKTFHTILQQQSTEENRDTECVLRFTFTKSEKLFNVLNGEGIGNVTTFFLVNLKRRKHHELWNKGRCKESAMRGHRKNLSPKRDSNPRPSVFSYG